MTDDNVASVPLELDRRHALVATASAISGAGLLATLGSTESKAQISVSEFTVTDAEFASEVRPVVDARLAWAYDVDSDVGAVVVGLTLEGQQLASERLNTSTQTAESTTELAAVVTDHDQYALEDLAGAETQLQVGATLTVESAGGSVLVETTAQDSATVVVADSGDAQVGGSVEFRKPE